jgi:hypothetical protein
MTVCTKPPPGWRCTREEGHDGPCAAEPLTCGKTEGWCEDCPNRPSEGFELEDEGLHPATIPYVCLVFSLAGAVAAAAINDLRLGLVFLIIAVAFAALGNELRG